MLEQVATLAVELKESHVLLHGDICDTEEHNKTGCCGTSLGGSRAAGELKDAVLLQHLPAKGLQNHSKN